MIDGCHYIDVVLLDGKLERHCEEQDRVVNRRWVDSSGRRGRWGIAAVQGYIQVADVVDRCAADYTSLL